MSRLSLLVEGFTEASAQVAREIKSPRTTPEVRRALKSEALALERGWKGHAGATSIGRLARVLGRPVTSEEASQGLRGATLALEAEGREPDTGTTEETASLQDRVRELEAAQATSRAEAEWLEAGALSGLLPEARADFLTRAREVFGEGTTPTPSPRRPGEDLSPREFADDLYDEAPHLYYKSTGGGAGGAHQGMIGHRDTSGMSPQQLRREGFSIEDVAAGLHLGGQS